jgi:hypothetical protein
MKNVMMKLLGLATLALAMSACSGTTVVTTGGGGGGGTILTTMLGTT